MTSSPIISQSCSPKWCIQAARVHVRKFRSNLFDTARAEDIGTGSLPRRRRSGRSSDGGAVIPSSALLPVSLCGRRCLWKALSTVWLRIVGRLLCSAPWTHPQTIPNRYCPPHRNIGWSKCLLSSSCNVDCWSVPSLTVIWRIWCEPFVALVGCSMPKQLELEAPSFSDQGGFAPITQKNEYLNKVI